jgi:PAS domain S-box-containing protein
MDETDKWLGRAVKTLQESETTYRRLFESLDEAIQISKLIFDDEGHPIDNIILDINPAYEQQTGLKRDEVIGRNIKDILPVVEQVWLDRYAEVVHEGISMHFEEYNAGINRWFDVHATPLKDNNFVAIFTDITERKKTEEEVQESEEKLRSVLDNTRDVIVRFNIQTGVYEFVSASVVDLIGYTPDEFINMDLETALKLVHPDDASVLQEAMAHSKEVGKAEVEYRQGHKNGKYIWVSNHMSVQKDNSGKPIYRISSIRDIAERRKVEDSTKELLKKEQKLTEELQSSNEELQSTSEELQVTNEELHQKEDTLIHINIELQKSEQRLRRLYDSDLFGVIYWNMDNKIEDANDKFLEMVGYTRDDLKSGLINWSEMTPPEYKYLDERSVVELKATGVNKEPFEKEYIRKDGTRIPIIIAGAMLDELKFNGVAFVLDITERKKAEESLIQSQKLLQDIINGFPSPIFVKDTEGRFLTVNKNLEELLGVKNEELKGKTDYDIITKELADYYRDNDQKVLEEGKSLAIEEEADLIDGHHTFIANKFPIYDSNGKPYGVGSISTDITGLKKIEDNLKESEERLRLAQTLGNVGIWDWNTITNELHFTPELEQLYGLTPGTIKTYQDWRQLTHPDDIEKIEAERDEKIANHEPFDLEFRIQHKSGQKHWLSAKGGAIYNDEGDILRVLGINEDITERINRENELEITMNELKRSNEELERFAYVSSHDLQEPLRMVTLYSQLLERRYKASLDDDADDFIEYIVENAKRMKYLIDDLLEYSRVTSQAKEFENIDLEKVLKDVLSNLSIPIVENKVNVTHDPLPIVFADKNQIMQVFENLITNAIKFRGEEPPNIDISAQKGEKEWIFVFKDNGIGISPKHQRQIFEVFKRLHTREEYPGTGIGLSIVQKIIERHNGRIWVESEPRKGSTFYFTIPT